MRIILATILVLLIIVFLAITVTRVKRPTAPAVTTGSATQFTASMAEVTGCPPEYDKLVIRQLVRKFVLLTKDNIGTSELRERQCYKIECYRAWADTLSDPCLKKSYRDWLTHYSDRLAEAEEMAVRNPLGRDLQYDAWERKQQEEERHLKVFGHQHPLPNLPNCPNSR